VPARVTRDVEHAEARHLVALLQTALDRVARSGHGSPEDLVDQRVGLALEDQPGPVSCQTPSATCLIAGPA
jgi:hypothetical protein